MRRRLLASHLLLLISAHASLAGSPAPESGPCSLENATPAAVAAIDDDFDLLLDDGRRAALAGLEFPVPPEKGATDRRAAARRRLSDWLAGRDVFLGAFVAVPDRWGHLPARVFAPQGAGGEGPLVSVGGAILEEGLARFRPDPAVAPCATAYLSAEAAAREASRGLWSDSAARPVDPAAPGASATLLRRKGLTIVEGKIRSVGETRGGVYLNFGEKRVEDFSVVILRRNLAIFAQSGIEPKSLIGRRARVRGLIETGLGPRMEISTPAEIEVIEPVSP